MRSDKWASVLGVKSTTDAMDRAPVSVRHCLGDSGLGSILAGLALGPVSKPYANARWRTIQVGKRRIGTWLAGTASQVPRPQDLVVTEPVSVQPALAFSGNVK
jgi:hypothetical protein